MRQTFLTFIVSLLAVCSAGTSYARSDLTLYPVEIVAKKSHTWTVAVDIPCGGHLFGFLVQKTGDRAVEIGAAIKRERVMCASWPDRHLVKVDFLPKGYTVQAKVVRDLTTRLTLGTVREIRSRPTKTGSSKLFAVYEDKCRNAYGTLVRKQGSRLEFAIAHRKDIDTAEKDCQVREKIGRLAGVRSYGHDKLVPLTKRTKELDKEFRLHLAPVKQSSLKVSQIAGLTIEYGRACNEAPVGIVLRRTEAGVMRVGVLLAEYYNMLCDADKAGFVKLSNEDISLPKGYRLEAIQPPSKGNPNLALRMPTKWEEQQIGASDDKNGGFVLKYYEGCGKLVGSVYSHDTAGNLVVGVLQHKKPGQCQKGAREASLQQPVIFDSSATKVLPLRVKGLKGH